MDARFYNSEEIDIERLAQDLMNVYNAQGYQTQQIGNKDQMLVQIKKGGDLEALVGLQAALSLTIQRTGGGTLAAIGQQKWLDKAAVGTIGIIGFAFLWPLAITAGAGALRQASLGNQVLNIVDGLVHQQRPDVQMGPVPAQFMPQMQQQWGNPPGYRQQAPFYTPPAQQQPQTPPTYTPPQPAYTPPQPMSQQAPAQLRCTNCNTPYEQGDTFCSGCGRSLTPAKIYCANCHAELKPGASFCPNCGSSTFQQTVTPAGSARPQQAPPVQPKPAAPVYTPTQQTPPAPPKPAVPVYTPPANPLTPPVQPRVEPYVAPPAVQKPKPAPEPLYVPPVTQEPVVQPQPKVTMIPTDTAGAETLSAPPQPKPQPQYYIPSNPQAQTASQAQQLAASQSTIANQPVQSQQSTVDATVPWGVLTFADSKQVELTGASALVGRYDHDLGGERPAVDLSDQQGADTTSRVHAVFEHNGTTYTLTDLNSTNSTRINNKRLDPDKATPINDGDTILFGKVSSTYKKL